MLHTWSLAVEEQFYLALPPMMWAVVRLSNGKRFALPMALGVIGGASLGLSIWLIATGASENAFFMSPPRAWEFLIGSAIAIEGLPVLRNRLLAHGVRAIAVVMILVPVFTYQQGPDFPGYRALLPCAGAALFIWSGSEIPNQVRHPLSFLSMLRFCGQISYSLYLWHWPLFTFARFSKASLTLDLVDKTILFAATVIISYLSWRFVEQPFRDRRLAPTRRSAIATAALATLVLLAGSAGGIFLSARPSHDDRAAAQMDAYNNYDSERLYDYRGCFTPVNDTFSDACLRLVPGKTNVLLWGDSFAAHYFHGLGAAVDPQVVNVLQATQLACMPTLNATAPGVGSCRQFATQMQAFFGARKPDLVVISADWLEYARPPRFDGMIADLKETIARLNASGIRIVLLGPAVQFRSRLPSMLARASLRGVDARADDMVLPDIFALDRMMQAALPNTDGFSYISVVDAVCPQRQCPLTVGNGIPLSWDHAHLTAEGSVYVMRLMAPMLGLE